MLKRQERKLSDTMATIAILDGMRNLDFEASFFYVVV